VGREAALPPESRRGRSNVKLGGFTAGSNNTIVLSTDLGTGACALR
jgi:hypothetical protein